jgi:DNA-directed RNA polymerase subunit E'/Rpb7
MSVGKEMIFKEAIVRKHDEAEAPTPNLDALVSSAQEFQEGREIRVRLTAEPVDSMKKKAIITHESPGFGTFSMWCDEGTSIGGEASAPAPLDYFSAAVAF